MRAILLTVPDAHDCRQLAILPTVGDKHLVGALLTLWRQILKDLFHVHQGFGSLTG
jgi:hypothetical protein